MDYLVLCLIGFACGVVSTFVFLEAKRRRLLDMKSEQATREEEFQRAVAEAQKQYEQRQRQVREEIERVKKEQEDQQLRFNEAAQELASALSNLNFRVGSERRFPRGLTLPSRGNCEQARLWRVKLRATRPPQPPFLVWT